MKMIRRIAILACLCLVGIISCKNSEIPTDTKGYGGGGGGSQGAGQGGGGH